MAASLALSHLTWRSVSLRLSQLLVWFQLAWRLFRDYEASGILSFEGIPAGGPPNGGPAPVPEPATFSLFAAGAAAMVARSRGRRAR
jgi:hypothetical protein